ncbi:MAG: hypothetical protein JRN68_08630 [Nitrososphaerota archaeon]|nr:hypothetical protein [Nitrososphaerota archaeon]
MPDDLPDQLKIISTIQQIKDRFGPRVFGQIMQTLLALSFKEAGYHVVNNTVGVPDIKLLGSISKDGYEIEVKTGDEFVSLTKRDIDGIKTVSLVP